MKFKLLAIPLVSMLFGFIGGHTIHQVAGMTVFGLIWGVIAMFIAPRLARRGSQSIKAANMPIYIMLPLSLIVLGGSILGHLAGPTPSTFLQLQQQAGYGLFFFAVHTPFEWLLMPWALMVSWHRPNRRRLLIITAVIFYLGRTASALYFAPHALYWGAHPIDAAMHFNDMALWIRLDFIRVLLQDTTVATLLLLAALHAKFRLVSTPPTVKL
jgi:hypothetical protein